MISRLTVSSRMPSVIGRLSGVLDSIREKSLMELVNETRICVKDVCDNLFFFFFRLKIKIHFINRCLKYTHVTPVPVRGDALVGDAHAEAADTAKLIFRRQIERVRLTLIASKTGRVLL